MLTQQGFPPCTRASVARLTAITPRPKGSEGRSYRFPLPSERVGSLSVKGRDERTTSALDSVPPLSIPLASVKGQAKRDAVGQPLTLLTAPNTLPAREQSKTASLCLTASVREAVMGQGTCPLSGSRGRQPLPSESVELATTERYK